MELAQWLRKRTAGMEDIQFSNIRRAAGFLITTFAVSDGGQESCIVALEQGNGPQLLFEARAWLLSPW